MHWTTSYPLFALRALALGESQVTGDHVNEVKDLLERCFPVWVHEGVPDEAFRQAILASSD